MLYPGWSILRVNSTIIATTLVIFTGCAKADEVDETDDGMLSVTSVSQLSDVRPTDWSFQALQTLVERYGCLVGYSTQTYRGNQSLSRFEFAAGVNACINRMNDLIQSETSPLLKKEDLLKLQKIQDQYAVELGVIRGFANHLDNQISSLESQQFSTTTNLFGEAILSFTTQNEFDQVGSDNITVVQNRVRLDFQTSFTGKDILHTRLATGNASQLFGSSGSAEGTQSLSVGSTNPDNSVQLDWLSYLFPIGDRLLTYVAATGAKHSDYVASTFSPYFQDYDGGNGALSTFGQSSPIYRIGGGKGVGLTYKWNDSLAFSFGYLAGDSAFDLVGNDGLFNSNYSFLGQVTFSKGNRLQFGLTYIHGYHTGNTPIFNSGYANQFFTGTTLANIHFGRSATTNSYGMQSSIKISKHFSINGFLGYTNIDISNVGNHNIWYYGLGLAFPDIGQLGNLGGIVFGVEPYLSSTEKGIPNDTSFHIEAFYKLHISDQISVTPGAIWITSPNQSAENRSIFIGIVRTTFRF